MAEQDIDTGIGKLQRGAVTAAQLDVQAQARGLGLAQFEAVRIGVGALQLRWGEHLVEAPERPALAAADVQQHRGRRRRLVEQATQVVDRYPQHMVLPGVAAQEPEAEAGFFDVTVAVVRLLAHAPSRAQTSDSMRRRRLGSLTNGLRSSQA